MKVGGNEKLNKQVHVYIQFTEINRVLSFVKQRICAVSDISPDNCSYGMDKRMLVITGVLCSHLSEQLVCFVFCQGTMHLRVSFSNASRNTDIIVLFASTW